MCYSYSIPTLKKFSGEYKGVKCIEQDFRRVCHPVFGSSRNNLLKSPILDWSFMGNKFNLNI